MRLKYSRTCRTGVSTSTNPNDSTVLRISDIIYRKKGWQGVQSIKSLILSIESHGINNILMPTSCQYKIASLHHLCSFPKGICYFRICNHIYVPENKICLYDISYENDIFELKHTSNAYIHLKFFYKIQKIFG